VIIVFQPVDDSRDAVFIQRHLKVDQQAKSLVGEPEIGQEMLLVDRVEHLDGLDFHDDLVFDHQIGPESLLAIQGDGFAILLGELRPQQPTPVVQPFFDGGSAELVGGRL